MKEKMKFKTAYKKMREGLKIKRVSWGGYWQWEKGTIMIHCKDGRVLDIRQTNNVDFTIGNINSNDWEIATPENCELLKKETTMGRLFDTAESFLKAYQKFNSLEPTVSSVHIQEKGGPAFVIKVEKV